MSANIDKASVVIIGGGIFGCSSAYHLAKGGRRDVVVIERNELGSGATAQSAGLLLQGRSNIDVFHLVRRTLEAIVELETELNDHIGFKRVGSLRIAATDVSVQAIRDMNAVLQKHLIAAEYMQEAEARQLVPWLDASCARLIQYVPGDGFVDAYMLTSAYAKVARSLGVRFLRHTGVTRVLTDSGKVCAVQTDRGRIRCSWVVDAAGAWAQTVADSVGIRLPMAPVRSHYWITAPDPLFPRTHPVVVLPDARAFTRPELGALLLGLRELESRTYDARKLPAKMAALQFVEPEDDMELLIEHSALLRPYMPSLDQFRFAHHICGFSTYTPDNRFLLGPVGSIEGFLVAGGCCGSGVAVSGGIGETIANFILGRPLKIDLDSFCPERCGKIDVYDPAFRAQCAAARARK